MYFNKKMFETNIFVLTYDKKICIMIIVNCFKSDFKKTIETENN
jgi:hypothetical protein